MLDSLKRNWKGMVLMLLVIWVVNLLSGVKRMKLMEQLLAMRIWCLRIIR